MVVFGGHRLGLCHLVLGHKGDGPLVLLKWQGSELHVAEGSAVGLWDPLCSQGRPLHWSPILCS